MREAKRYDMEYVGSGDVYDIFNHEMTAVEDGEYVLASDYDVLLAENKRLQKVILDSSGCFTKAQIEAILDDNDLDRG